MPLFSNKKESIKKTAAKKLAVSKKKVSKKSKKKVIALSPFSHILLSPIVTEKAYTLAEQNKYVFCVQTRSSKKQIARAVADIYSVEVLNVHTMTKKKQKRVFRGITGMTKSQKKAIVTIADGEKIDLFE